MKTFLSLIKSSLHDIRCCDETTTVVVDGITTAWRSLSSSLTCVLNDAAKNTGYVHVSTLEQYNTATGLATGITKPNLAGDVNFVPDYLDITRCALPVAGVNPPVSSNCTLSNHAFCKGSLTVVDGFSTVFAINYYQSLPDLGSGLLTFTVETHQAADGVTPVPVLVIVNGLASISSGSITLSVQSPILSIDIRPSDYVVL